MLVIGHTIIGIQLFPNVNHKAGISFFKPEQPCASYWPHTVIRIQFSQMTISKLGLAVGSQW